MSRCVVLGFDGRSVGEFEAPVSRSWALISPTVAGGGKSTIVLPADVRSSSWLKIGNLVFIEQEKLPTWVGMIDTPWNALDPVQISVYNIEYILSTRFLDQPVVITGTPYYIVKTLIDTANAQEETYLRVQDHYIGPMLTIEAAFVQKDIWSQLKTFAQTNGIEIYFSAHHRERDQQMIIDLNIFRTAGQPTGFELRDGGDGNMRTVSASLEGVIQNRIVGVGKQSTAAERTILPPAFDNESVKKYRMRGGIFQGDGTNESQLANQVNIFMASAARPRLKLTVEVLDVGDAFENMRLGNSVMVHASSVRLPGGKAGWRGTARIIVMVYNESNNTISLSLEALL